jgi:hypothetical protein
MHQRFNDDADEYLWNVCSGLYKSMRPYTLVLPSGVDRFETGRIIFARGSGCKGSSFRSTIPVATVPKVRFVAGNNLGLDTNDDHNECFPSPCAHEYRRRFPHLPRSRPRYRFIPVSSLNSAGQALVNSLIVWLYPGPAFTISTPFVSWIEPLRSLFPHRCSVSAAQTPTSPT